MSVFNIPSSRIRWGTTRGYSMTYEVYFTSVKSRKVIEKNYSDRLELLQGDLGIAYISGRLDGD